MEPTEPVTITLQAQEWNVVIEGLHELKYRLAAPIINSIGQQAMAPRQMAAEQEAQDPATPAPVSNGHDAAAAPTDA